MVVSAVYCRHRSFLDLTVLIQRNLFAVVVFHTEVPIRSPFLFFQNFSYFEIPALDAGQKRVTTIANSVYIEDWIIKTIAMRIALIRDRVTHIFPRNACEIVRCALPVSDW